MIAKLDKIYLPEKNQRTCAILEKFEGFTRSPGMTMSGFIIEFERLHCQLKEYGCTYPDGVLAFRLMKSANMSKEHESLCRATVETDKWSYETVKQQIKKIFHDFTAVKSDIDTYSLDKPVKVEPTYLSSSFQPHECYLGSNSFEDYNSIRYENYTNEDESEMASSPQVLAGEPSLSYNGYREPEEYDVYYGPSRSNNRGSWKWKQNNRYPNARMNPGTWKSNSESQTFQNSRNYPKMNETHGNNTTTNRSPFASLFLPIFPG